VRYGAEERRLLGDVLAALPGFSREGIVRMGMQRCLMALCLDLVASNEHVVGAAGAWDGSGLPAGAWSTAPFSPPREEQSVEG